MVLRFMIQLSMDLAFLDAKLELGRRYDCRRCKGGGSLRCNEFYVYS